MNVEAVRKNARALDPEQVETALRGVRDVRDRALFWLIYGGRVRCHEALAINLVDIDWTERAISIRNKGELAREMFFSRHVSRYLDDCLTQRGAPTVGPVFITMRKARSPRRAELTADGNARLSYRQADTLWKKYTPGWDLQRFAIRPSARGPHGVTTRSNSSASVAICRCAVSRCTSPTIARPLNAKRATGSDEIMHSENGRFSGPPAALAKHVSAQIGKR